MGYSIFYLRHVILALKTPILLNSKTFRLTSLANNFITCLAIWSRGIFEVVDVVELNQISNCFPKNGFLGSKFFGPPILCDFWVLSIRYLAIFLGSGGLSFACPKLRQGRSWPAHFRTETAQGNPWLARV